MRLFLALIALCLFSTASSKFDRSRRLRALRAEKQKNRAREYANWEQTIEGADGSERRMLQEQVLGGGRQPFIGTRHEVSENIVATSSLGNTDDSPPSPAITAFANRHSKLRRLSNELKKKREIIRDPNNLGGDGKSATPGPKKEQVRMYSNIPKSRTSTTVSPQDDSDEDEKKAVTSSTEEVNSSESSTQSTRGGRFEPAWDGGEMEAVDRDAAMRRRSDEKKARAYSARSEEGESKELVTTTGQPSSIELSPFRPDYIPRDKTMRTVRPRRDVVSGSEEQQNDEQRNDEQQNDEQQNDESKESDPSKSTKKESEEQDDEARSGESEEALAMSKESSKENRNESEESAETRPSLTRRNLNNIGDEIPRVDLRKGLSKTLGNEVKKGVIFYDALGRPDAATVRSRLPLPPFRGAAALTGRSTGVVRRLRGGLRYY